MKISLPFPYGHDIIIEHDRRIICKGILDKTLKDKTIIIKGIKDTDILEIRELLIEEVKRQKKEA